MHAAPLRTDWAALSNHWPDPRSLAGLRLRVMLGTGCCASTHVSMQAPAELLGMADSQEVGMETTHFELEYRTVQQGTENEAVRTPHFT
eukprot:461213-Pelagomonas_calceolata.AAC.7